LEFSAAVLVILERAPGVSPWTYQCHRQLRE
jgi:hypothetical protein